ncbi:hypothetical protein [Nocardia gipuzkoensis]|uniref:hypothetical protein n=1 Tax=Nocardia gipuzkoensis TaxID=2749991 RepID=UPI003EE08F77
MQLGHGPPTWIMEPSRSPATMWTTTATRGAGSSSDVERNRQGDIRNRDGDGWIVTAASSRSIDRACVRRRPWCGIGVGGHIFSFAGSTPGSSVKHVLGIEIEQRAKLGTILGSAGATRDAELGLIVKTSQSTWKGFRSH